LLRLSRSTDLDLRLLPFDCEVTRAHARTLASSGLLSEDEVHDVDLTCDDIVREWEDGNLPLADVDEDVHSVVERLLTERLGDTGRRIHAGRSRNDLVATDVRLWSRAAAHALGERLGELISVIAGVAEQHAGSVMPGYTHLQRAQPVTLGFHLLAHGFALGRDLVRLQAAENSADVSPLGAGALAGTTLPLDPQLAADHLGFGGVFENATDAVADRDFLLDLVYACAVCGTHLSRLAEEIVLWTSSEFGFARLSDEWSTGSSMMPQKRNPDMAELVRGRAAGGIADLTGLLALIKGLPLAYNRDLQEDKAYAFEAVDRLLGCLEGMAGMLAHLEFDVDALEQAASGGGSWATDVAERLVGQGVPFREAHEMTARRVAGSLDGGDAGGDLPGPRDSVAGRSNRGGTAAPEVARQIEALRSLLARYSGRAPTG
jgi:argininosuccinate lyase